MEVSFATSAEETMAIAPVSLSKGVFGQKGTVKDRNNSKEIAKEPQNAVKQLLHARELWKSLKRSKKKR